MNCQLAVRVLQIRRSCKTEPRGDTLQAASKSFVITRPTQIEMWAGKLRNVKRVEHSRHIERATVERDEQPDVVQQIEEVVQIFVLDEC